MNAILTTFILLALLALGIFLMRKDWDWESGPIGLILVFASAVLLFFHAVYVIAAPYDYGQFEAKRNAFETTLNEARATGNQMEAVAILKEVAEWNADLASRKYDNSTFLFGQYVDDRIETLKPIK